MSTDSALAWSLGATHLRYPTPLSILPIVAASRRFPDADAHPEIDAGALADGLLAADSPADLFAVGAPDALSVAVPVSLAVVRMRAAVAAHVVAAALADLADASLVVVRGWLADPAENAAGSTAAGADSPGASSVAVPGSLLAVGSYAADSAARHLLAAVECSSTDLAGSSRAAGESVAAPQLFPKSDVVRARLDDY
jgi:hypothetical protein